MKNKMQKYHDSYVSRRQSAVVASSLEALKFEERARELEDKGKYRLAAHQWLKVLDAATGDVERARIAMCREQCITRSNTRRNMDNGGDMAGRYVG